MSQCLYACPDTAPFYSESSQQCTQECDSKLVKVDELNKYVCTDSCEQYFRQITVNGFIINQCVNKCNDDEFILDKQCVKSCKEHNLIADDSGKCVEQCNHFIYNKNDTQVCVKQCPANASYITQSEEGQLTCTSQCVSGYQLERFVLPDLPETFAFKCIDNCSTFINETQLCDLGYSDFTYINVSFDEIENTLIYTNVTECQNFIYTHNLCISSCNKYILLQNNSSYCQNTPETGFYITNNQQKFVVDNCSEITTTKSYYKIDNLIECAIESCPKQSLTGQCIESCKQYGLVFDEEQQVCIQRSQCEKQLNITEDETYCQQCEYQNCMQCSINSYITINEVKKCTKIDTIYFPIKNGSEYILVCPNDKKFYDRQNQQCIEECNITYNYQDQYMCVDKCDTKMFEPQYIANLKSFICLTECKNPNLYQIFEDKIICQPECNMMYFNYDTLECVLNCDQYYNEQERKCVSYCDKYYYLNDHTNHKQCATQCPQNYMSDINGGGECLQRVMKETEDSYSFITIICLSIVWASLILIIIIISIKIRQKFNINRKNQRQLSLPQVFNAIMTQQKRYNKRNKNTNILIPKSLLQTKNQVPVIIYDENNDYTSDNKTPSSNQVQNRAEIPDEKQNANNDVKERSVKLINLFK